MAVSPADLVPLQQENLPDHPLLLLRVDVDKAAAVEVFALLLVGPRSLFAGESGYTLAFRRKIAHNGSYGETGRFPPPATAWSCAASELLFIPPRFYIHTFPGSL